MTRWGFLLPMASAILAILYPKEFTVYDRRVCECLAGFHDLANRSAFDVVWEGYCRFLEAVDDATPDGLSLRDKDRWLWGKSFYENLKRLAESVFADEEPIPIPNML